MKPLTSSILLIVAAFALAAVGGCVKEPSPSQPAVNLAPHPATRPEKELTWFEIKEQASAIAEQADMELNKVCQQLIAILPDKEKENFIGAQQAWKDFRNAQSIFEADYTGCGSDYHVNFPSCYAGLTQDRTTQLRQTLKERLDRNQDDLGDVVERQTKPASDLPPATVSHKITGKELILDLGDKVTMKLARIPAGRFLMGSPVDEKDREDNEGPQHEVTISKPFYMGICEVTQEQYRRVMGYNPSDDEGATHPVDVVSWDDAMEFCRKLSQKTGQTVQLPTEAQWEYACRAGTTTRFSFGDKEKNLSQYAWWGYEQDEREKTTYPVGQKKPNHWGLYDMHGNVWEWCADRYADSYTDANDIDPAGPASGPYRVLRAGGWRYDPQASRSAFRLWNDPRYRFRHIGFRVIVTVR